MTKRNPDFFPRRVNQFVSGMTYAADVSMADSRVMAKLEGLVAPDVDYFRATGAVTSGQQAITLSGTGVLPHKYGAAVLITWTPGSGAAGERAFQVDGYDYLGQRMTERIAITSGTTAASGAKAFKEVTRVSIQSGAAASGIEVGFGSRWGLPYRTTQIGFQSYHPTDGAAEVLSSGVLTAGHTTSNAASGPVSGTADPRGTFAAAATTSGTASAPAVQFVECYVDRTKLHGYKHFAATSGAQL